MTQLLCTIIGHREYDPEILAAQPWLDRDIRGYSQSDFRELNCLRCGQPLQSKAA
jgi:hypothetical protein